MELTALIILAVIFAAWSAADDADEIALNEPIAHALQWIVRAIVIGVPCLILGLPWLSIGLAFLFSAVFRYRLNKVRDLDWRYVSPSSWYDWQFLRITLFDGFNSKVQDPIQYHREFYIPTGRNYQYQWAVHRAGLLAYIVEFLVFGVVLYLHL